SLQRLRLPRRHGLQPGLAEPPQIPRWEDRDVRRRGAQARTPDLLPRAGDRGRPALLSPHAPPRARPPCPPAGPGPAAPRRAAQATVLAPTGTIGLLMDCDTTGVEPDFALIKFKKLAGGGSFKIVNQSVPRALKKLGYKPDEVQAIVDYVRGTATLKSIAEFSPKELLARGLLESEIGKVEKSLESVFDLRAAFAPHVLGAACLSRLGLAATD